MLGLRCLPVVARYSARKLRAKPGRRPTRQLSCLSYLGRSADYPYMTTTILRGGNTYTTMSSGSTTRHASALQSHSTSIFTESL